MAAFNPGETTTDVRRRTRAVCAVAIGVGAAFFFVLSTQIASGRVPTDFEFWWRATRLWAAGSDPYLVLPRHATWPLPDPVFYPAPALLVTWPLHALRMTVAGAIFVGTASAWLAWLLMRQGLWRLWFFATPAFVIAAKLGQWSPLLSVAALIPSAGFLMACKPSLGLAVLVYRPTWRAASSAGAIILVSLTLFPTWPAEWLRNLHVLAGHSPPIMTPIGSLMILGLLRWRQPEARLLVAMACVPQLLFFYDQLILGLIARSKGEAQFLTGASCAAFLAWGIRISNGDLYVEMAAPYVLLGCYVPALIILMRRRNEGPVPLWIDGLVGRLTRKVAPPGHDAA